MNQTEHSICLHTHTMMIGNAKNALQSFVDKCSKSKECETQVLKRKLCLPQDIEIRFNPLFLHKISTCTPLGAFRKRIKKTQVKLGLSPPPHMFYMSYTWEGSSLSTPRHFTEQLRWASILSLVPVTQLQRQNKLHQLHCYRFRGSKQFVSVTSFLSLMHKKSNWLHLLRQQKLVTVTSLRLGC